MTANQPPPLVDYNLYESDPPLREAVEREGAAWSHDWLHGIFQERGNQ